LQATGDGASPLVAKQTLSAIYRAHRSQTGFAMTARIYKPSKTAMQSGTANTKAWALDFDLSEPRQVEPLMGWTSSADTRQQLRLRFESREEAVAYCERHGIAYQVFEPKVPGRRTISYADNFSFKRRDAWTH
jgi:hypothetical protein